MAKAELDDQCPMCANRRPGARRRGRVGREPRGEDLGDPLPSPVGEELFLGQPCAHFFCVVTGRRDRAISFGGREFIPKPSGIWDHPEHDLLPVGRRCERAVPQVGGIFVAVRRIAPVDGPVIAARGGSAPTEVRDRGSWRWVMSSQAGAGRRVLGAGGKQRRADEQARQPSCEGVPTPPLPSGANRAGR